MNSNGFADKLECFVVFFGSLPSGSSLFVWGGSPALSIASRIPPALGTSDLRETKEGRS